MGLCAMEHEKGEAVNVDLWIDTATAYVTVCDVKYHISIERVEMALYCCRMNRNGSCEVIKTWMSESPAAAKIAIEKWAAEEEALGHRCYYCRSRPAQWRGNGYRVRWCAGCKELEVHD